jgi:hypothetical protein
LGGAAFSSYSFPGEFSIPAADFLALVYLLRRLASAADLPVL